MPKDRVRIAVIGAGEMANKVHYPSLASFPDVHLAALCDLDTERLRATGDRWAIEARFTDYQAMIEQVAPDGVYCIGQPHIMFDLWVWLLRQRQNLYIEKPMGLTLHQAQVLAHLADQANVVTQVSFQRRACPLLVKLRQQVLDRGPIHHAVCEFYKCEPHSMLGARDRMMDDTVHSIDTLRWLCGGNLVRLDSRCRRYGTLDINWVGATLEFDTGATGYLLNSWTSGRRVFRVEMHGHQICAEGDAEGLGHVYADGDCAGRSFDARDVAGGREFFEYGGFKAKNREFIDSLLSGHPRTGSPFSDALKTMEIASRILARDEG